MSLLKQLVMNMKDTVHVETYLQSGNIVFGVKASTADIPKLEDQISSAVEDKCGFRPDVFVMTVEYFKEAAARNPYVEECKEDMKSVHMFIFPREYVFDSEYLTVANQLKSPTESICYVDRTLFLYSPDGFGISQLARKIEKVFGSPSTARNWRSVTNILEMAEGMMANSSNNCEEKSSGCKRIVVAKESDSCAPKQKKKAKNSKV